MRQYITVCEATEKELEEEKKDHAYDIKYLNQVVKDLTKELETVSKKAVEQYRKDSNLIGLLEARNMQLKKAYGELKEKRGED
jgi:predicted RNase H-like nuclease (RuvC/YqgF family)